MRAVVLRSAPAYRTIECGERKGPHVHIVKRRNLNGASAKTGRPVKIVDGVITGGTIRRASPAMVDSYHEYVAEDYYRVRALAQTDLVLVHTVGATAGQALSTHGARQMIERAGRRAGLGLVKPHAFRHTWATALTEATGGNTKAVADEGGWSSSQTVEETYAHLAGDPTLEAALATIWGQNRVTGAPYLIASVEDLFALDPLARFAALIAGPNFDGYLRAEPIRFDPAHPIYGNSCRVPGCAMHSTQAEWWCTRHGQSRRDALRAGVGEAQWLAAAVPFGSKQANRPAQPRLPACRFCPDRDATAGDLCREHAMLLAHARRRVHGFSEDSWAARQVALPGAGDCRVEDCPRRAESEPSLCPSHRRAWVASRPADRS